MDNSLCFIPHPIQYFLPGKYVFISQIWFLDVDSSLLRKQNKTKWINKRWTKDEKKESVIGPWIRDITKKLMSPLLPKSVSFMTITSGAAAGNFFHIPVVGQVLLSLKSGSSCLPATVIKSNYGKCCTITSKTVWKARHLSLILQPTPLTRVKLKSDTVNLQN